MKDYVELWERLRKEICHLINQEVKSIDPVIVLVFMGFLEQSQEDKDEQSDKG